MKSNKYWLNVFNKAIELIEKKNLHGEIAFKAARNYIDDKETDQLKLMDNKEILELK